MVLVLEYIIYFFSGLVDRIVNRILDFNDNVDIENLFKLTLKHKNKNKSGR